MMTATDMQPQSSAPHQNYRANGHITTKPAKEYGEEYEITAEMAAKFFACRVICW